MFIDFIFAFVFALLLTVVFSWVFKRTGPWGEIAFFATIFVTGWAGGIWIGPIGTPIWGTYWLGFLFVGMTAALFLAAATPKKFDTKEKRRRVFRSLGDVAMIGFTFWIAMLILIGVIAMHYL